MILYVSTFSRKLFIHILDLRLVTCPIAEFAVEQRERVIDIFKEFSAPVENYAISLPDSGIAAANF